MARKKINYDIGNVISVANDDGQQLALCRIEGMDKKGAVIGRFFWKGEEIDDARVRLIGDSFLWIFGDLHIVDGKWPIVGVDDNFVLKPDVIFGFLNSVPIRDQSWIAYRDIRVKEIESVKLLDAEKPIFTSNSAKGAKFVEIRLKQILEGLKTPFD